MKCSPAIFTGFQNHVTSMNFHQDTKRTIMASRNLVATSSTEDHCPDKPDTIWEAPTDVQQCHLDPFNENLKELTWNSHFIPSDIPQLDKSVYLPTADSQLVMALRIDNKTKTDRNLAHQKSYLGLQKASEIMDLLEIFPGQHRREDPQAENTRKWIEKINMELENKEEQTDYEKNIRAEVKKNRKKDCSQKNSKSRWAKKGCAVSKVDLYKKYHVRVPAGQSSSSASTCDSSAEPVENNWEGQKFVVYMNESGSFFKDRCKHGISNHLPKKPPHWFMGLGRNGYTKIVPRNGRSDSRPQVSEHKPVRYCKHTRLSGHRQRPRHHKRRGSSDDSLNFKRKSTGKKEIIVREPKKRETMDRQRRDVRVPSRSVSVSRSSSSDSFVYKKRHPHNVRHSGKDERTVKHVYDDDRYDHHRHSMEEFRRSKKNENMFSKTMRTSFDLSNQKNDQPKKSAMKKTVVKSFSNVTSTESDSTSSDSSSSSSIHSIRDKTHRSHGKEYSENNQTARRMKISHSPLAVKHVKVKKKVPNVLHNYRQRLVTADSKPSANYEKVNVKDFIDFLATLSRNTISTLTNKKKALKLYRDYLSSPRRR